MGSESNCIIFTSAHPCAPIMAPRHGAMLCNNWRKEYAGVCFYVCLDGYTFPPGFSSNIWYTCGATGMWSPPSLLTECISNGEKSIYVCVLFLEMISLFLNKFYDAPKLSTFFQIFTVAIKRCTKLTLYLSYTIHFFVGFSKTVLLIFKGVCCKCNF